MKILIAEDDRVSRLLLETTLRAWGYETVSAGDGAEACALMLSEEPPSIAILDWMMPAMDGVEVTRAVRQQPETRTTYIILLTAKQETEDIVAALDAGADDYLTKPFAREELRVRVQAGARIVALQSSLAVRIAELED